MKISLDLRPLSVNRAYKGRRFNTFEKHVYDAKLRFLLPKIVIPGPYYRVHYKFFLKNFKITDQQNFLKCLTDGIVRRGIIKDDRFIIWELIEKFPSDKDRIEIDIESAELNGDTNGR